MSEKKRTPDEGPTDGPGGQIDYSEIRKLVDFLEERDLSLFELETAGFKIKIGRAAARQSAAFPQFAPQFAPQAAGQSQETAQASQPAEKQSASPASAGAGNVHYVTSPMVGTMYRASSPSSDPFVEVGDMVKKGQTMCIIEAMKLMNEIEADIDGKVVEVLSENGKPVEYGQKLFAIEPQGQNQG